jgi:DeoR/GlpR family transcriptional regulator of sugar metabolism
VEPELRRQRILAELDEIDQDLIPHLSQRYGVSEMTIRRDLKLLEEAGAIIRTHGGAVRWPAQMSDAPFAAWKRREAVARAAKDAIARYVAETLVSDQDTIILEGGTTVAAMGKYLAKKHELTVVTNGFWTLARLHHLLGSDASLLCSGGILQSDTSTFVGPTTKGFFQGLHVDRVFLSATGLTPETGATDPKMLEVEIKRDMAHSGREVILLLDSSKLGIRSLLTVLEPEQITLLVTDSGAPADMVAALQARGVPIEIVQLGETDQSN